MSQINVPRYMLNDLETFIARYYTKHLPHPMLIAQAFCLQYKEYGKAFEFSTITNAVEYVLSHSLV